MDQPTGRESDIQRIVALVRDGRSVVVSGELGVGKSALLHHLATVQRQDSPVETIACHAAASRIPFGALVGRLSDPSESPTVQLAGAITRLRGAKRGRLLILVDDIQHTDPSTVAVLHGVLDDPHIQLVATARSSDPMPTEVIDLWRQVQPERIELSPLSIDATTMLVADRIGVAPDDATAREIAARSRGNPLFAVELAKAHLAGADTGLTPHLTGLVGQRIEALPDAAKEQLMVIAIGQPVDTALPIVDLDTLAELEASGLVMTSMEDGHLVARAAHPIYGEVVRTQLTPLQRHTMSRQLASALLALPARRRGDALRIVNWVLDAGDRPSGDLAKAAAYEALGWLDHGLAEHLATIAVEETRTPETLLALGEVRRVVGDSSTAGVILHEAFALATEDEHIRQVALALAQLNAHYFRTNAGAVDVLDQALHRVRDPAIRLSLESEALLRRTKQDHRIFIAESERLLADPNCNDVAAWTVLFNVLWVCTSRAYFERFDYYATRAERLERLLPPDRDGEIDLTRALRISVEMERGRSDAGIDIATAWLDEAHRRGIAAGCSLWSLGYVRFARGELEAMGAVLKQSLEHLLVYDRFNLRAIVCALRAIHASAVGDAAGAQRFVAQAADFAEGGAPFIHIWAPRSHAWLAARRGDFGRAVDLAASAGRAGSETDDVAWSLMAYHDAVMWGGAERVAAVMEKLGAETRGADDLEAMVDHAIAAAAGDHVALVDCLGRFRRYGTHLASAGVATSLAAITAGAEARRWATIARATVPTVPLPRHVDELALSPRQIDVARRAASGMSSKEIAGELYLSVRTVDNHLHEAYRGLEVDGRPELTRLLSGF